MVNQKAISLKINFDLFEELEKEANLGWTKRNTHINNAIRLYLEVLDLRRSVRACPAARDGLIEAFLKKRII